MVVPWLSRHAKGWCRAALPLAVLAVFSALSNGRAMCVYNDMDTQMTVTFTDCGWSCRNTWTVQPGGSACRPSTAGNLYGGLPVEPYFTLQVTAHGYVVLYNLGGRARGACAYYNDDTLERFTSFTFPPTGD